MRAGPIGFGLGQRVPATRIQFVVEVPSKPQRPSEDRVKTDARDAEHLTRLTQLGKVTLVRVPEPSQEACGPGPVTWGRAADLMRIRHRSRRFC